jgi:3-oxoacyl-[acyl-carrier-protein] synthase-3
MGKAVLVIAANVLTRRVNQSDPATVSIFSDGAGAVVLVPADPSQLLGSHLGSDGSDYDGITVPAGGTREPLTPAGLAEGRHLMVLKRGSAFFRQAVHRMAAAGREAMKAAHVEPDAIDWWIPHQANGRLIEDAGKLLGIPTARTINVIERYGNSSSATIPIALAHAVEHGQVRNGQTLLLTAVGAGMLNAGLVLRY